MELKIKLVNTDIVTNIPKYAKKGDAGLDLTATSETIIDESGFGYIEYGTNIAMEIPEGYYGMLVPRSSISKTGMILASSPSTIDSGYRGEIKCRFKWIKDSIKYNVGERIAQLIILPYPNIELIVVEELTETERGDGGFGSSGK